MTWAEAAAIVAQRWAGRVTVPPDEPVAGDDELAFWDEVEALVRADDRSALDEPR